MRSAASAWRELIVALTIALSTVGGCASSHTRTPGPSLDAAATEIDAGPPSVADAAVDRDAPSACTAERCNGRDDDCDGAVDESSGGCVLPAATSVCRDGGCALDTCQIGYADCDGASDNGCEIDTSSDRSNCGGCGVECALHETCDRGACVDDPIVDVDPASFEHACMVLASGRLLCWGRRRFPVLASERSEDLVLQPVEVLGLPELRDVEVGDLHTCAIDRAGAVLCWGDNLGGRLGVGHGEPVDELVVVDLPLPARDMALAASHACARLEDDSVWCFGVAIDGRYLAPVPPTRVEGLPSALHVVEMGYAVCAVSGGGGWWCWGFDRSGRFALPERRGGYIYPPVLGAPTGLDRVNCSSSHCCGVRAGVVECWGANESGQLGRGAISDAIFPPEALFRFATVTDVACATTVDGSASCVQTADGQLWCWGASELNALGGMESQVPTHVDRLEPVRRLWAGRRSLCALVGPQRLRCWGVNAVGQLGDGSIEHRFVPTAVLGFE